MSGTWVIGSSYQCYHGVRFSVMSVGHLAGERDEMSVQLHSLLQSSVVPVPDVDSSRDITLVLSSYQSVAIISECCH